MTKVTSKTKYCPECGSSWFAGPIKPEDREFYSPPYFYSRLIGIYDRNKDSTIYYICPDCKTKFERHG